MCFPHALFSLLPKTTKANLSSSLCPSMGSKPDSAAAASARLESCTDPSELARIHAHVLRNALLRVSFHWNALVRAYLRLAGPRPALRLFLEMARAGAPSDHYSLPLALKAAALAFAPATGRQLHAVAAKAGLEQHEYSECGLLSLYAKAGEFDAARKVFDGNPQRKLGSWNAIISGFSQGGRLAEAIDVFIELRQSGSVPDDVTMVSVASACGGLGDLGLAQQVHKCVLQARRSGRLEVMLSNSLIDMYGKCGRTDLARRVFDRIPQKDVSSWTAMIMGLATHGRANEALEFFRAMKRDGVRPNGVTMVGVLTACAHGGRVEEGMGYLKAMARGEMAGVEATVAHYGCVVDMLGREGRVEEAAGVIEEMPMAANEVIWGTLLGACEKHGNVAVGEVAARRLAELERWNDGVYVVLSNIYAAAGMWAEVERLRRVMRERKVAKTPGYSLTSLSA